MAPGLVDVLVGGLEVGFAEGLGVELAVGAEVGFSDEGVVGFGAPDFGGELPPEGFPFGGGGGIALLVLPGGGVKGCGGNGRGVPAFDAPGVPPPSPPVGLPSFWAGTTT